RVLRSENKGFASPSKGLAVLADPVFGRGDSRVRASTTARAGKPEATGRAGLSEETLIRRSVRDAGETGGLPPLPFTRREARAISRLVSPAKRLEALDFEANLATATSPELSQYRFVHFATHGFIDAVHPELSGLVLSLVDREGRDREGFLPATEVFNL